MTPDFVLPRSVSNIFLAKPELHVQTAECAGTLHVAFESHPPLLDEHGFVQVRPSPAYPLPQVQVGVAADEGSVQSAFASQPPLFRLQTV